MLPVHNTAGGPVPDTLRALVDAPGVHARREVVLGIEFALLVRPGTRPGEVRTVTGHPHARAQVTGWLAAFLPRARWMSAPSNAAGARWVRDGRCDAAVAGEFTAARYGLAVAAAGVQDHPGAVTRFLLLAPAAAPGREARGDGPHRTSLAGRADGTPHETRAALALLCARPALRRLPVAFAVTDGGDGRSALLVDCPGRPEDPATARALRHLRRGVPELRLLGSYPAAAAPVAVPPVATAVAAAPAASRSACAWARPAGSPPAAAVPSAPARARPAAAPVPAGSGPPRTAPP
ncbi:hypothetical protein BJP39_20410, partial [Streptomyces sp. CC77]